MLKVGLTGGIASGKSTISNMIKEMNIPIIDADKVSREVLNIYPHINEKIKQYFGEKYFDEEGNLIRKKLGNHVFKYEEERKKLERIIMPFIKKEIFKQFEEYYKKGTSICVLDAATLIENNMHEDMDFNILVWTNKKVQVQRVMKRDNIDEIETLNRINSQMELDEKKKYINYSIDNSGTIENTRKQVKDIMIKLKIL